MFKNSRGAFLVLTALLLPGITTFWGWIISGAMLINIRVNQQIAADCAVLSAVTLDNNVTNATATNLSNRATTIYQFYTPSVTPTISVTQTSGGGGGGGNPNAPGQQKKKSKGATSVTLSAALPAQSLFLTQSTTINTTATAITGVVGNANTAILQALP